MVDAEIIRKANVADEIGDHGKGRRRDDDRHGGEAIKAIGKVHGVAETGHDEGGKGNVEQAQIKPGILQERQIEGEAGAAGDPRAGEACNQELHGQAGPAGNALVALLGHLFIIIHETDSAETQRHQQAGPHEAIAEIHPH